MTIPKEFLVRQTTFADYISRTFGPLDTLPESLRAHLARREMELLSSCTTGDELWEWDMDGWEALSGRAGLAIVREGKVIKSCMMLFS